MQSSQQPSGLKTIAKREVELERLLKEIPLENRGILFERVLRQFHPQENTRMLELGFAEVWAGKNKGNSDKLLESILRTDESDPQRRFVPINEREWQVARLVAATLIQWLPTTVGCAFLREAFEKGGGEFSYTLPKISETLD